jgi:hypothetical protein
MTELELEIVGRAHENIQRALELLLDKSMHEVAGIGDVRQAVVSAENLVGRLLSGVREPFR